MLYVNKIFWYICIYNWHLNKSNSYYKKQADESSKFRFENTEILLNDQRSIYTFASVIFERLTLYTVDQEPFSHLLWEINFVKISRIFYYYPHIF